MYDRQDGCLIIGLCVCGSFALTVFALATLISYHAPGQHSAGTDKWLLLSCLGSWVFTIGLIFAEALRGQFRRPRR